MTSPEIRTAYMFGSKALGDSVWNAFILTGLRHLFPDAKLYCPTEGVAAQIFDEQLADASLETVPKGISRKIEGMELVVLPENWNILLPGDATLKNVRLPPVHFYQSQGSDAYMYSPHYERTGEPHVVDAYLALIREQFPELPHIDRPQMPDVSKEWEKVKSYVQSGRPLVTINTGASLEWKQYPIEKWLDVADELISEGAQVILIGGKGDPAPPLLWRLKRERATSLIGKLSLRESMALLRASDVHLSGDTGTGHIAAAYGRKTVTLFGKGSHSEIARPYGDKGIVIEADDHGPKDLSVAQVVEAATRALEE